jgi:predicted O-methyltransferase YrrM
MQPQRHDAETTEPERAELRKAIAETNARGAHLEIGTAAGATLVDMMTAFAAGSRPRFVVVDPLTYFENQRASIETNLRAAGVEPAEVDLRVGLSWPTYREARKRDERYAFQFIDGNHEPKYVMRDLSWTSLLMVGGCVCLHDHVAEYPGVRIAVRWFLRRNPNFEVVGQVDSLVVLRKTREGRRITVSALQRWSADVLGVAMQWRRSLRKRWRNLSGRRPQVRMSG